MFFPSLAMLARVTYLVLPNWDGYKKSAVMPIILRSSITILEVINELTRKEHKDEILAKQKTLRGLSKALR